MIDRDTIIRLAREAGFRTGSYTLSNGDSCVFAASVSATDCIPELERFAALVADAERETCAKVCRDIMDDFWTGDDRWETARYCSEMILERGNK